jgi:hypothetical protein
MYGRDGIESKIIAVGVGGALLLAMGPLLAITDRADWLSYCLLTLSYAVIAGVVAFIWPQLNWRTGLWFFVFVPPSLLVSLFFTAEVPINWNAELKSLSEYALAFASACFGGWLGAMISKSRGKKLNTAPPADAG